MKTTKFLLASIMMTAVLSLSATRATDPVKGESNEESARCGVSLAQMKTYLEGTPHYHTVYEIQYISGTCNGLADIGGGWTATVYVEGSSIIGHSDSSGG